MNWIRLIISLLFVLLLYGPVYSQTFPCDGTLLFSTNQGFPPNQIFKVFMAPFGVTTFNPLYAFPNAQFDALGFNSTDNYIYGVNVGSNEIVRIKSDRTFETVGRVSMVDVLDAGAGDCTADGLYLLHDNTLDQLLVYEVVNNFALVDQIDLFWDPNSRNSGPVTTHFGDIAIDPNNPGIAYTYQGDFNDPDLEPSRTRGYLHRINIDRSSDNVGMVTPVGKISPDIILKLGSLFFTSGGGLFGYGAYSRGLNLKQNRLISIDQFSGNATAFDASGPIAEVTDGCSCPYSVSFENITDPLDVLCTNTEITFKLTITNRFFYSLNDLVITDTIPEGMVIKEITGDRVGEIASGTGVGTQSLTMTGISVPPKGVINVNIVATVIDIGIEFIPNQAHLKNLPERLGSTMLSDDPSTINSLGDPTKFFGNAQRLNEFEVSIVHPTDCLEDTTGTVLFSSPVLIAGEQYQVNLRDQDYDVTSYEVTMDRNNSFILEDLMPGEYELFKITPRSTRCSFAMKDTTINIIPPNEFLKVTATSNSPVCESMPIEFSATLSPGGDVKWTGPVFESDLLRPRIENAVPEQSGTYEMIATYGICEQVRTIEVIVAPEVMASISGKDQYCESDSMQLIAEGQGDTISFQWLRPGNVQDTTQMVEVSSLSLENDGMYQVIIDNGACQDTATKTISVVATPRITLPEEIETHFCEPLVLDPVIANDNDLTYSWSPQEALSCDDCPNPELLIPFAPKFKLNVSNINSCADSAEVEVKLLKDKLIYIPNVFSPNSDGVHDYFKLSPGCGVESISKVKVFDRFGAAIYEEGPIDYQDSRAFWDGSVRGEKGYIGVYYYQVELDLVDGKKRYLSGDVTLLR